MRLINKKHLAVLGAVSTDEKRYILNGVKFEETKTGLKAIATDGRVLAIVESTDDPKCSEYPTIQGIEAAKNTADSALVPTQAIRNVLKSWPKTSRTLPILDNAIVKFTDKVSTFATTDLESPNIVEAKNIEGQFPNYEQIIPRKGSATFQIVVDPVKLANTLMMAAKITTSDSASVLLSFQGSLNPFVVTGENLGFTFTGVVMPMKGKETLVDRCADLECKVRDLETKLAAKTDKKS